MDDRDTYHEKISRSLAKKALQLNLGVWVSIKYWDKNDCSKTLALEANKLQATEISNLQARRTTLMYIIIF